MNQLQLSVLIVSICIAAVIAYFCDKEMKKNFISLEENDIPMSNHYAIFLYLAIFVNVFISVLILYAADFPLDVIIIGALVVGIVVSAVLYFVLGLVFIIPIITIYHIIEQRLRIIKKARFCRRLQLFFGLFAVLMLVPWLYVAVTENILLLLTTPVSYLITLNFIHLRKKKLPAREIRRLEKEARELEYLNDPFWR